MPEYSEKGLTLRWDAPDLVSSEWNLGALSSSLQPVPRIPPTWSPPSILSTAARLVSRADIDCELVPSLTEKNCSP